MSKRQSGLAFVANRRFVSLAGAALLLAAGWVGSASANEVPPIRSKSTATSAATSVAVKRPAATWSATRRPSPDHQLVRVASVERRTNACNFFFCWREFPLLLGVGFANRNRCSDGVWR